MSDHMSSSDEDFEELLNVITILKNLNYFEEVIPQYDDHQYKEHFRISRQKTVEIAERFGTSEYFNYQENDSPKISPLKFITIFLWFAGNEAVSFRDVADRFNVAKSSLYKIIRRVTYFLSNLSREYITWPMEQEMTVIENYFRENNFPGVSGIIDGTHIRIDKPKEDPDSYLNRKNYFSIQAQIVCDHKRKVRDIFVGYPGSVHDSRILRNSPLYDTLPQKCQNRFLLGDSGYPCLPHLMTPFKDRGQLTRRQRNYNYLLSKNRYIIEHCFGLMKQRFRQLYHIKLRSIRDITHFIRACAVLHNIAIDDDYAALNEEEYEINENDPQEMAAIDDAEDNAEGLQRRNHVMNNLPFLLN